MAYIVKSYHNYVDGDVLGIEWNIANSMTEAHGLSIRTITLELSGEMLGCVIFRPGKATCSGKQQLDMLCCFNHTLDV